MKTSTFIRLAKSHLWDGKGEDPGKRRYICYCLEIQSQLPVDSQNPDYLNKSVEHITVEHIMRLLGGYVYLESWLVGVAKVPRHELEADLPRLQATRLAWMEDMAQWFEAQGD